MEVQRDPGFKINSWSQLLMQKLGFEPGSHHVNHLNHHVLHRPTLVFKHICIWGVCGNLGTTPGVAQGLFLAQCSEVHCGAWD